MNTRAPTRNSHLTLIAAAGLLLTSAPALRAADFSGRVLDEEGRPVPHALVQVAPAAQKSPQWLLADNDGQWRAVNLTVPPGPVPVYAYEPSVELPAQILPVDEPQDDLTAGRAVIRLTHADPVTLKVQDADHKPVDGAAAALVAKPPPGSVLPQPVHIPADGVTVGLARGNPQLLVRAKGFAPRVVTFAVNGPTTVTIQLGRGQPLVARIEDPHGRAIPGATLRPIGWTGLDANVDLGVSLLTGPDGHVEWDDAPNAAIHAEASAPGFLTLSSTLLKPLSDNDITLTPQAPIHFHLQEAAKETTGESAAAALKNITITRGVIDGKTTTWDDQPLPAAALAPDKSAGGDLAYTESHAHDALLFRIAGPDVAPTQTAPVPLDGKEHTLTVKLQHGTRISGTLVDTVGHPAASIPVRLLPSDWQKSQPAADFSQLLSPDAQQHNAADFATTDAAGRFSFPPQSGPVFLLAQSDAGYLFAPIKPDAPPASLTLAPWGQIAGTLHQGSRPAAANTWVTARAEASDMPAFQGAGKTDLQGRFRIPRMIAGNATVSGPGAPSERVEVVPGKVAEVSLGGAGRTIVGTLANLPAPSTTAEPAEPVLETIVPFPTVTLPPDFLTATAADREAFYDAWRISPEGAAFLAASAHSVALSHATHVQLQTDGAFRIEGLRAGDYRLLVGPLQYTFTVPPMPQGVADTPLTLGTLNPTPAYSDLLGQNAPDFLFIRFDGKPLTLSSQWKAGKVLLLEFWASTSPESTQQEADLKNIFDTLGPAAGRTSNLEILSLSTDADPNAARAYVAAHAMPWTHTWIGPTPTAFPAQLFQVHTLPLFILITPEGKITALSPTPTPLRPALEQALNQH